MRGSMLARAAGCALAASFFAGVAGAADIADLAPRSSFVVASIDNWPSVKRDIERNGIMDLWKDERVREYIETLLGAVPGEGMLDEMRDDLSDLGINIDDLPALGTRSGVASFYGARQGVDGRALEGDDAEVMVHFLAVTMLDGEAADDGRDLWETIDEAIERSEEAGEFEVEVVNYGDADAFRLISRYEVEEWDEDAWEKWDPEAPDADENFPEPKMVEVVDVSYVARASDHVIYTTSFDVLRDTIDRLAGQDRGETIGDVRAFVDGRDTKPAGAHAYMVAIPRAMAREGEAFDDLPLPVGLDDASRDRVLSILGLSDVTSLSMSVVTDAPGSVAEVSFAALMPEKRGVFSLISGAPIPATPPSFVGPDAATLGVFRVNFAGIVPLVREVINALPDAPEMEGVQLQFEQFASPVEPLLNAIGPEVVQVGTLTRPFGTTSAGSLVAISMKDANAVRNAINTLGGMAALMPRDFAGSQIWESQFFPIAIGLGASHVFIGEATGVEKAMLAASQPDAPKLADDPRFAAARRAMGDGGIALGWQDMKTTLEYAAWRAENFEQVTRAEAAAFGMPEEQLDEYVQFMVDQAPAAARTAPPVDSFTRVLGDVVTVFGSTERGIEGRMRFLKATR